MVNLLFEEGHANHTNSYIEDSVFCRFFHQQPWREAGMSSGEIGSAAMPPLAILYTIALKVDGSHRG